MSYGSKTAVADALKPTQDQTTSIPQFLLFKLCCMGMLPPHFSNLGSGKIINTYMINLIDGLYGPYDLIDDLNEY